MKNKKPNKFFIGKPKSGCLIFLAEFYTIRIPQQNENVNAFNMSVRKVFLYGRETWPVVTENVQ